MPLTYIDLENGLRKLRSAITAFTGNANEIIATDGSGLISADLLPPGVANKIITATAGEALTAGNLVYFDEADSGNVYIADQTAAGGGNWAEGYVLTSVAAAASVDVYVDGANTGIAGLTEGDTYWLSTAGGVTDTAPTLAASGDVSQVVGFADANGNLCYQPQSPICLA